VDAAQDSELGLEAEGGCPGAGRHLECRLFDHEGKIMLVARSKGGFG
jgi:hypothetical protein